MKNPKVGDVVVIGAPPHKPSEETEFALVLEVHQNTVTCVRVSDDIYDATECDVVVPIEILDEKHEVAVLSLAEAIVAQQQVLRLIDHVHPEISDEIISCRYGDPSDEFRHGTYLLPPMLDGRHEHLTTLIRDFTDRFSLGNYVGWLEDPYADVISRVLALKEIAGLRLDDKLTLSEIVELEDATRMFLARLEEKKQDAWEQQERELGLTLLAPTARSVNHEVQSDKVRQGIF